MSFLSPVGVRCRLQINISFPNETWNGLLLWQLYIESSSDYFVASRDELGYYGGRSGTIDAFVGEEIYVFLGFAGGGYADHYTEALESGKLTINASLTAIPHMADLTTDGRIYPPLSNDCQAVLFIFWTNIIAKKSNIF